MQSWFWCESFWLPAGFSWEDVAPGGPENYPNFVDVLTYPILIGFLMHFSRFYILNPFLFTPIAFKFGLRNRQRKSMQSNDLLENLFAKCDSKISEYAKKSAAYKLNWTIKQVERWLRIRSKQSKVNKLQKFQESGFIALYHLVITIYGIYVLWNKPWTKDISKTWIGFPKLEMCNGMWWYYMFSVSFYLSTCFSRIKFSVPMCLHHFSTIVLLVFSWAVNLVRAGSLVLLVHECGDIPLQLAKMSEYLKIRRITNVFYIIFFCIWTITRLGLFPFWIMSNVYFEAPKHVFMPAGNLFYFFLFGITLLNILWTKMIIQVMCRSLCKGSDLNDIRSSDSSDFSDTDAKSSKILRYCRK